VGLDLRRAKPASIGFDFEKDHPAPPHCYKVGRSGEKTRPALAAPGGLVGDVNNHPASPGEGGDDSFLYLTLFSFEAHIAMRLSHDHPLQAAGLPPTRDYKPL